MSERVCPLLSLELRQQMSYHTSVSLSVQKCHKEKCAWWGGDNCAILRIVEELYYLRMKPRGEE